MVGMWTYPWHLLDNPDESFAELIDLGVEEIEVAAHYHSIRTLNPRTPESLFTRSPGGCFFQPNPESFADTPIEPQVRSVSGASDPLGEVVDAASEHGIDVNAWTVCFHNSALGDANPDFQIQDAFGTSHAHALCPSHPAVQRYLAGVVESLSNYDVAGVGLESLGFPSVLHPHGAHFGHAKNYAATDPTTEILLSQCFCAGCRDAASDHAVDLDRVQKVVQNLCRESLGSASTPLPPLSTLIEDHPVLADLFDFRGEVIDSTVAKIADASNDLPLHYFMSDGLGRDPGDGWPAGIRLDCIQDALDGIIALCYTGDPEVAQERVVQTNQAVDCRVDAGLALDPELLPDEATYRAVVEAVDPVLDGTLRLYNHGLLTDEHLDWLRPSPLAAVEGRRS